MRKKRTVHPLFVLKEAFLTSLALASIGLVMFEIFGSPNAMQHRSIDHIDFIIACIFLGDFMIELFVAKNKAYYLKRNWYFLLAAIPITDGVTESLRGIRALRLIRLVRAGEHIDFGLQQSRPRPVAKRRR